MGNFQYGIFKLPNLRVLDVGYNEGLIGYLPDFTWSSPLELLTLAATGFSGELPPSIGNLSYYLNALDVSGCNFTGSIPSSLGNLTNLQLETSLINFLVFHITLSIGHRSIPSSLGNLTNSSLSNNSFSHLHFYDSLILCRNQLTGRIPNSIFNLTNLQYLDLSMNYFSGTVEFDEFVKLKHLTMLYLSYNQFSLLFKEPNANATFPKFQNLALSSCNLSKFPDFLRNQDELEYLVLSENNLRGQVPEWMLNIGKASLELICLANNFLTGFAQNPILLPWTRLSILDLRSNLLQGLLPIPPASTLQYYVSNNSLSGNVPTLFCNHSSLQVLDLASNNLTGSLPQCLDNFGASLSILDLRRNKFQGSIPQSWVKGSQLKIIIFGQNKFQGHLPRSLVNCTMLKVLDLSNNLFNDGFPSWLENLPNLEVLILRSNKFKGPIKTSKSEYMFPNLQIIDLSYNSFVGKLPLELFRNLKVRKSETADHHLTYIHVYSSFTFFFKSFGRSYQMSYGYDYSMTMTNKGTNLFYEKVLESFIAVDMSSNRFSREILNSIENLRGCHLLNLSNNILTGHIPPSLGNHVELEALDLSHNKLKGEIPSELTQITSLGFFNVSHNNLTGPIPQGNQFNTFEKSSFEGNLGLCGRPLTRKCGNSNELPSQPSISPVKTLNHHLNLVGK
jgi:Leucine-rich repeat (LRR) protein